MVDQLARPKDTAEIYWFSEQPYGHVGNEDLEKYDSGRLGFPNTYFDPHKASILYNQYHEQYALADEVGFDGIMSNEHHASYWCMKPAVNLDAAVIAKLTKRVKIAILGNVIAVNDPIRMAEEIAMLDCYSGGRIISGFVRGTAVETLQGGIEPSENRARFEEAHDLIIKCWTEPGPFRYEGQYYHYRVVNPWVVPMQKPRPDIWFPGTGSPESVVWAAKHKHPYMNLGALGGHHRVVEADLHRHRRGRRLAGRPRALRLSAPLPGGGHRREGHRVGPRVHVDHRAPPARDRWNTTTRPATSPGPRLKSRPSAPPATLPAPADLAWDLATTSCAASTTS